MCGRFALQIAWRDVAEALGLSEEEAGRNVPARHNIAPTQDVPIVSDADTGRQRVDASWGLVPRWAKLGQLKTKPINARGETVASKPMFRSAVAHGRCLVPADAWYEWTKETDGKQPHRVRREEDGVIAFAAIMDENEALEVRSVAIITVAAAKSVSAIHHRMPAVLPPDWYEIWLDRDVDTVEALKALDHVETAFVHEPISRDINSARFSGAAQPINPR